MKIKKLLVIISALTLILSMQWTVFAAGTVTFHGDSEKFVFAPGSTHSPTDLFPDLKGIMPGDSLTQKIHIHNDVKNGVKIKLYLKSAGASQDSADFLSQLKLTVSQDGNSPLYSGPANESGNLSQWVYLGTFYSGAQVDLTVTLDVPLELDNAYQEAIGYLDWQFKAEELPIEPGDPEPPKTGDDSNLFLPVILTAVSGIAVLILLFARKKKD